jgi:hypothetical protein
VPSWHAPSAAASPLMCPRQAVVGLQHVLPRSRPREAGRAIRVRQRAATAGTRPMAHIYVIQITMQIAGQPCGTAIVSRLLIPLSTWRTGGCLAHSLMLARLASEQTL